jgi:hypothetical protein
VRNGEVRRPIVATRLAKAAEPDLDTCGTLRMEPELAAISVDVLALERLDDRSQALLNQCARRATLSAHISRNRQPCFTGRP